MINHQSSLDAFHELDLKQAQKLEGVYDRVEDGCRDAIFLKFSHSVLEFKLDIDHDTIEVNNFKTERLDLSKLNFLNKVNPWSSQLGRVFGWGWVTVNQQGYQDGVILSFDGLEPAVMLLAAASSIRIFSVTQTPD